MAVVNAFQNNRIRDPWLMACTRTLWYCTAAYNIDITVKHIYVVYKTYTLIPCLGGESMSTRIVPVVRYFKKFKWKNITQDMLIPNFQI